MLNKFPQIIKYEFSQTIKPINSFIIWYACRHFFPSTKKIPEKNFPNVKNSFPFKSSQDYEKKKSSFISFVILNAVLLLHIQIEAKKWKSHEMCKVKNVDMICSSSLFIFHRIIWTFSFLLFLCRSHLGFFGWRMKEVCDIPFAISQLKIFSQHLACRQIRDSSKH